MTIARERDRSCRSTSREVGANFDSASRPSPAAPRRFSRRPRADGAAFSRARDVVTARGASLAEGRLSASAAPSQSHTFEQSLYQVIDIQVDIRHFFLPLTDWPDVRGLARIRLARAFAPPRRETQSRRVLIRVRAVIDCGFSPGAHLRTVLPRRTSPRDSARLAAAAKMLRWPPA